MQIAATLHASPWWRDTGPRGFDCVARLATRTALMVLLSSAGGLLAADDGRPDDGLPATDIRRELLSEFKYSPAKKPPDSATPVQSVPKSQQRLDPSSAASSDAVRMAPFEVQDTRTPRNLPALLVQEEPKSPAETIVSKLGIGVHSWKLGKTKLSIHTLFYIPFFVGLEW
jgi:hypothetical protein